MKQKLTYICHTCQKTFDRKSNYEDHINRRKNCLDKVKQICEICDEEFDRPNHLAKHLETKKHKNNLERQRNLVKTTNQLRKERDEFIESIRKELWEKWEEKKQLKAEKEKEEKEKAEKENKESKENKGENKESKENELSEEDKKEKLRHEKILKKVGNYLQAKEKQLINLDNEVTNLLQKTKNEITQHIDKYSESDMKQVYDTDINLKGDRINNILSSENVNITQNNIHNFNINLSITPQGESNIFIVNPNKLAHLTNKKDFKSLFTGLVEYTNFNEDFPQNHNVFMSEPNSKKAHCWDGKGKLRRKDAYLTAKYLVSFGLTDVCDMLREYLGDAYVDEFEKRLHQYDDCETLNNVVYSEVINNVMDLMYKKRYIVMKTIKKLEDKRDIKKQVVDKINEMS